MFFNNFNIFGSQMNAYLFICSLLMWHKLESILDSTLTYRWIVSSRPLLCGGKKEVETDWSRAAAGLEIRKTIQYIYDMQWYTTGVYKTKNSNKGPNQQQDWPNRGPKFIFSISFWLFNFILINTNLIFWVWTELNPLKMIHFSQW